MTASMGFPRYGDKQNSPAFEDYPGKLLEERDRIGLTDCIRQIDALIQKLTISEKFKDWAIKYLYFLRKEEAANYKTKSEENRKQLAVVSQHLDGLLFKYSSPENHDGAFISAEEYARMKSALLKEKSRLEDELNTQGAEKEEWLEMSERTFNFASYAGIWFAKGNDDVRRAIFSCLGSSLTLKDQKIAVSLRKPFEMIFEKLPEVQTEFARLEPHEMQANTMQFFNYMKQFPTLSG